MTTPKIFIVRIHKSDPWDKNLNQAKNDLYVNEFDHTSSNYETCDFMDGAVKMNLEEASRCAGILNKMHQNYAEIVVSNKMYGTTQQSKLNTL